MYWNGAWHIQLSNEKADISWTHSEVILRQGMYYRLVYIILTVLENNIEGVLSFTNVYQKIHGFLIEKHVKSSFCGCGIYMRNVQ